MIDILSGRALNRAVLERQLLLSRSDAPALEAIRLLIGLQAQDPNLPYLSLWARLRGFRHEDFTRLLYERDIVRSSVLRATQHVVTADDYLWLRPLVQPIVFKALRAGYWRDIEDWDLDELAAAARELLDGEMLTRPQIGKRLAERWPGRDRTVLGRTVQALLELVHPPPSGTWNTFGATPFALAEEWIGRPLQRNPSPDELIRRYLAAYGPASVKDFQMFSGLRRMDDAFDRLRPGLRTFRDESGAELFDVPGAPLPDPGVPAPARLLTDLDNLLLAYADRTRMMTVEQRKIVCVGAWVKATLLIDGKVQGVWTVERDKGAAKATLTIELFAPLSASEREDAESEAAGLLAFAHPDADGDVRFTTFDG
ncbi:winged helix DNA-binding domain-containing protein [Actinomadura sp. 9N407]|uniref:winged helix DNA-binding domain-containing protein n=1 Tax=Actinomadura sp. 9N407 TaxID=3375154 RepID=UPI0037AE4A8F